MLGVDCKLEVWRMKVLGVDGMFCVRRVCLLGTDGRKVVGVEDGDGLQVVDLDGEKDI